MYTIVKPFLKLNIFQTYYEVENFLNVKKKPLDRDQNMSNNEI